MLKNIPSVLSLLTLSVISSCQTGNKAEQSVEQVAISYEPLSVEDTVAILKEEVVFREEEVYVEPWPYELPDSFERAPIMERMALKKQNKIPLVVEIFVPLCDNEHQGIVPVNRSLGDGFNLRTNLYWGAGYGIGHYFTAHKDWKLVRTAVSPDSNTAEIRIFRGLIEGDTVYVVARAYWGDKMYACLTDFFNTLAGKRDQVLLLDDSSAIKTGHNTDLVCFNGHNGLMDYSNFPFIEDTDTLCTDAVVIGCVSYNFFAERLRMAGGFPLVTTTNFMAPEAYVIEPVIRNWALGKSGESIRLSAGDGYHSVQQCGFRGARNLFRTGW